MADPSLLLELWGKASQIVQKGLKCKGTSKSLQCTVDELAPVVEQMKRHVKMMDHPTEEIDELMRKMEATHKVISKYSKICWYNFFLTPYYQTKLEEADQSLVRYITVQLQVQMARDLKVIRSQLSSDDSHSTQTTFAAETQTSYGSPTFKGDYELREPEFTVELGDPLDELKSDVNLSDLAGSGKTALVDMASSSSSASCRHSTQTTFAAETQTSYGSPTFKGDFETPEPEFTVGLRDPLDELKFDVNLSGLAGSGKTALVDMASSSSSASCQIPKKYDVFISFRGEDTRSNFTSHLHAALCRSKVTFIDDRLQKGDEVWPSLVKAIEESTLFLIVFSQNYASSTWCLNELTKILEYSEDKRLPVIPVFYNIEPSHVRKQTGSYQRAFSKHERNNHNYQQIQKWRAALTVAANLPGWDSSAYRDEAQLTGDIVNSVLKKLDTMFHSVYYSDKLFGIHDQIVRLESLVFNESEDVQFIGISGMAGIGKTTLARTLLDKSCFAFEGSCFLANIREKYKTYGKSHLLNELSSQLLEDEEPHMGMLDRESSYFSRRLRQKRVLVVLDDVNDPEQIRNLTGAPCWFGPGSRVIISSREKQVFRENIDYIYEVKALDFDQALQLFNFNAFKNKCPDKQFEELSKKIVDISKGIPSALIDLGYFFNGKSKEEWENQMKKITKNSGTKIQQILKLYDELDHEEKNIFLDIAGSLEGRTEEHIKKLIDAFGYLGIDGLGKELK